MRSQINYIIQFKMKKIILLSVLVIFSTIVFAQKQTFDLTNFTPPTGWKKETTQNAVQFSKQDLKTKNYCVLIVMKSIPGTTDAKENFNAAWESIIKDLVAVSGSPTLQPSVTENGWEAQSGFANYTDEGRTGIALLATSTGYDKMVNIIALTNTDTYQNEMNSFFESIDIKKPTTVTKTTTQTTTVVKPVAKNVSNGGFAFTSTNFDDGWTSVEKPDWVETTKGNVKVLLHYPKAGTVFPADPEPLTNAAWNILVAPRYSNLKNYKTTYISDYERTYLGFGNLTDNATGKEVFVVLFRKASSGWFEFITPDKNTFIQTFKFDPYSIKWDSESSLMNPLVKMGNYNKFAVGPSDFKGSWTSDFTGMQQWYSVNTGEYAGMSLNQSSQTFVFGAGNTYSWKLIAVNGMVGNMKFGQGTGKGTFKVLNNWQLYFSEMEGKAKTFNAYFSCIKGARVLWMLDAKFPGSGMYTGYGKQK